MKRIFTVFASLLLTAIVFAQTPQKMSYQAVIRNSANNLVTNKAVGMRVSILQGSVTGTEVYKEIYNPNPQTNDNGLLNIEIGTGIPLTGTFTAINWANGLYFIKTETDPTGGTDYTITGTSQLLSVPYALMAKNIENSAVTSEKLENNAITANKIAAMGATSGQVLTFSGTAWAPQTLPVTSNYWLSSGSNIYFNTGKVGIGTASPAAHLNILGNSTTTMPQLLLNEKDGDYSRLMFKTSSFATKDWTIAAKTEATDASSLFNIYYFNGISGKNILTVAGSGYVGINHSPDANRRLYVDGEASGAAYFANNSIGVNTLKAINQASSAAGYFENNGSGYTLCAKNLGAGPAIYCDGTLNITGGNSSEINRDQTGNANMVPICYGTVSDTGSKSVGSTPNFLVSRVGEGTYEITIDGENFAITTHTCVCSLHFVGFVYATALNNKIRVYTRSSGADLSDREFSFVVYKL